MKILSQPASRRLTPEELYALAWQRPMIRLAQDFGISGNGLAKICDRLEVPYPPRGYWAKKEAGKPVVNLRLLPRRQDDTPEEVEITPTPPTAVPAPEVARSADVAATKVVGIVVPDGVLFSCCNLNFTSNHLENRHSLHPFQYSIVDVR